MAHRAPVLQTGSTYFYKIHRIKPIQEKCQVSILGCLSLEIRTLQVTEVSKSATERKDRELVKYTE